jgi:hypothetical protein
VIVINPERPSRPYTRTGTACGRGEDVVAGVNASEVNCDIIWFPHQESW